ncbi:MAG TPA: hypothetical protein VIP57_13380 [Candidatus Dormibacteraeota bacterium]
MSWLFGRRSASPEDKFADEMVVLAKSLGGLNAERIDGFRLRLELPGGSTGIMNLGNIYREAQQLTGEARASRLRTAVLAMTPFVRPQTWDEAAPKLMPAVRSVSWLTTPPGPKPINKSFLPFLRLMCAIDSEHALSYVTDDDLHKWGVSDDQAFETATQNLAARTFQVGRSGQIAIVMGPDGYTSSWLAAPSKLFRIASDVAPEVVAVAAARDSLVLVDVADVRATLKVLEEELTEYQKAPRQLSPVPYRVTATGVEVWELPRSHPAWPQVEKAQRFLANVEYNQQGAVLDERLAKSGEDVYVASYSLVGLPDGSVWSWAVWGKQVTNGLLPQVDVVVMGDNDHKDDRFGVSWADAIRLAADWLVLEAELDPPRWRYRGWPPAATLAALRSVAVPFPPTPQ